MLADSFIILTLLLKLFGAINWPWAEVIITVLVVFAINYRFSKDTHKGLHL